MTRLGIVLIRIYQLTISPFFGNCCCYYPTCSEYALQALQKYGFWKGLYLTAKRLIRCHPWHLGGHDPVP